MSYYRKIASAMGVFLFVAVLMSCGQAFGQSSASPSPNAGPGLITDIGSPGPDAIDLKVWADKDSTQPFHRGERVIVQFQPDRDAQLMVLGVTAAGKPVLLFPNREMSDAKIEKGKFYTFFGDDSNVHVELGAESEMSSLVFLVASKPFDVQALLKPPATLGLAFQANTDKRLAQLRAIVKRMAEDKGFNRVILPIEGERGKGFAFKVTKAGAPGQSKTRLKALPSTIKSKKPETVTGVQGYGDRSPK